MQPVEIMRATKDKPPASALITCPGADAVLDLVSEASLRRTGLFRMRAVENLIGKARRRLALSEMEQMALVGILTTQAWYLTFVDPRASLAGVGSQPWRPQYAIAV